MRLALTNTVALNGGDAAIAFSILEAFQHVKPDALVEIHESQPSVATKYFPNHIWRPQISSLLDSRISIPKLGRVTQRLASTRIRTGLVASQGHLQQRYWHRTREQQALEDFAEIDAIVSTGGTYLVEQYHLERRLFEYEIATKLGIPLIFYTQSLGPFRKPYNRKILTPVFARSRLILLRDERSADHLRALGIQEDNMHVVADAVFGRTSPSLVFPLRRASGEPWKIAVSVRQWPPGAQVSHPQVRSFVSAMAAGLSNLARNLRVDVTFISTCQGIPEYWTNDSSTAQMISDAIDPSYSHHFHVDRNFHTPEEYSCYMKKFDLLIATRMHAAIQALTVGTPVIPIAYEFKTQELFRRLGLENYILYIDNLSGVLLSRTVQNFINDLEDLRAPLANAVSKERDAALRAVELLKDALDS